MLFQKYKSGYVAIAGRPNVGKSTLINALLKFKLSIITPKPQTTRTKVLGILSSENFQIILIDTPGLLTPKYRLQEAMVKAINRALHEADLILVMVDPRNAKTGDDELFRLVRDTSKPFMIAINKIDKVAKDKLLPLIGYYSKTYDALEVIPISALKRDGLDDLQNAIARALPIGPPLYPIDQISEQPERFFVSEILREKIFRNYGEEIPYSTAVVIDEFKERSHAKDYIKARIVVEKQSQKGILIGKKGQALRQLGRDARNDIEGFLGRSVYLELWVAVREKWRQKDSYLREYGYE